MSTLAYHLGGTPHGRPLMLLHGFLGSRKDWSECVKALEPWYRCLVPDLPGHGASLGFPFDAPLLPETVNRALVSILEKEQIDRVTVIGYSMGGRLALHFACSYPTRVDALVLESASAGICDEQERCARLAQDDARAAAILSHGIEEFVADWYEQPLFNSLSLQPGLKDALIAERIANSGPWMAKVVRELSPGLLPCLQEELSSISVPTLLLGGTLDPYYPKVLTLLQSRIPKSELRLIPKAGHTPHRERASRLLREIRYFLEMASQD